MPNPAINEKTTPSLLVAFRDKSGKPEVPSSVTYRIDCLTTGQQVLDDTALTAAATIEVVLTVAQTTMRNASLARETKRVTVKAAYSGGGAHNDYHDFDLINLSGVS